MNNKNLMQFGFATCMAQLTLGVTLAAAQSYCPTPLSGGVGGLGIEHDIIGVLSIPLEAGRTRVYRNCSKQIFSSASLVEIAQQLVSELDSCSDFERTVCEEGNGIFRLSEEQLVIRKNWNTERLSSGSRSHYCDYLDYQTPPSIDFDGNLIFPTPPEPPKNDSNILPYPTPVEELGSTPP